MTDYRATVHVELVDDRPTFAEVLIESIDRAIRHAAWPVDRSQLTSLQTAASRSVAHLETRATGLSEEMLRAAGFELRGRWMVDHDTVPAEDGGTCGSIDATAPVSGGL